MDHRFLTAAAMVAAFALPLSPAAAQNTYARHGSHESQRFTSPPAADGFGACRDFGRDGQRDGRRHRGDFRAGFPGDFQCSGFAYDDGQWALYNNRSWEPDSYNDWWNDRPDRAYPRWVQEQGRRGTCDPDRMWWSGSGWHC